MATMQAFDNAKVRRFRIAQSPAAAHSRAQGIAHSDIHPGVYRALIGTWAAFMSLFWIVFASSPYTVYLLMVITLYGVGFFGLPVIMNRMGEITPKAAASFSDFLHGTMETAGGLVSGVEALIQVILVPACLSVGGVFIAFIIVAARAGAGQ
jgi:hypothetical protein